MQPNTPTDWTPIPKIAAAALAAVVILGLVAIGAFLGVDLKAAGTQAVVLILAALGPVVVGYMKA